MRLLPRDEQSRQFQPAIPFESGIASLGAAGPRSCAASDSRLRNENSEYGEGRRLGGHLGTVKTSSPAPQIAPTSHSNGKNDPVPFRKIRGGGGAHSENAAKTAARSGLVTDCHMRPGESAVLKGPRPVVIGKPNLRNPPSGQRP